MTTYMKQFQVPQFITVEDKVIGPLTVKQAVYVLGGVILIIFSNLIFVPILFWPIAAVIAVLAGTLAFLKINDVPFPTIVKNGFFYFMRPRIYIWKKEDIGKRSEKKAASPQVTVQETPRLSESKLSDLAWSLNIKEKLRGPEEGGG